MYYKLGWWKKDLFTWILEVGMHLPTRGYSEGEKHIDSFPTRSSHYPRSDNSHRQYLSSELSRAKMYSLYKVWCCEKSELSSSWRVGIQENL